MTGRTFIDTNVFVYTFDEAEPGKQEQAKHILRETTDVVVSTQVMNEFCVVTTRKLATPLSAQAAADVVTQMSNYVCVAVDAELVLRAVRAGQRWQLSHWDALMVEAAHQAGCSVLLSEDMVDGAVYDGLKIENPFREVAHLAPQPPGPSSQ